MPVLVEKEPAYIDAAFEHACRRVDRQSRIVEQIVRSGELTSTRFELEQLCKTIRHARIEFEKVVESYGIDYEDQGRHFIDSVEHAARIAESIDYPEIVASIRKHADHVAAVQVEMKDR